MDFLPQVIGSGILQGLTYALIAMSLVLVYKSSDVFNFAVGEFCTVGAVFYLILHNLGLPLWLVIPGFLLMAAAFGGAVEKLIVDRLIGRDPMAITLVTIGISSILVGGLLIFFGANPEPVELPLPDMTVDAAGALFVSSQVWNGIIAVLAMGIILCLYKFSTIGILMRATADSQVKSIVLGINARRILTLTWSIAAMVSALGGLAVSNGSAVSYDMGVIGLAAIPVVLLGGLDSIPGAIIGGLIIGLVESITVFYLEPWLNLPGFAAIAPYIVLLLVLMLRPQGLFGKELIERV